MANLLLKSKLVDRSAMSYMTILDLFKKSGSSPLTVKYNVGEEVTKIIKGIPSSNNLPQDVQFSSAISPEVYTFKDTTSNFLLKFELNSTATENENEVTVTIFKESLPTVAPSTPVITENISKKAYDEILDVIQLADSDVDKVEYLSGMVDFEKYSTPSSYGQVWNQEMIDKLKKKFTLQDYSRIGGLEKNYFGTKTVDDMTIGVNLHVRNGKLTDHYVFWFPTTNKDIGVNELYHMVEGSEDKLAKYLRNDNESKGIKTVVGSGFIKRTQKRIKKKSKGTQKVRK